MQIPIEQELDPFAALRWENLLDDVNDAHNKMDFHIEQTDEWLHEFDARMLAHGKMATIMYHTINDLKQIIKTQQKQIEELQTVMRQCNFRPMILDQTSAKI